MRKHIFLLGGVLSGQTAGAGPEVVLTCDNGECVTTVTVTPDSWDMVIDCGEAGSWEGGRDEAWGGSLCGVSIVFE